MKVLIAGAGVAGLGIGWRLCQAGADVTIFERGAAARAATWAAAGMLAVAGEMGRSQSPDVDFARHASRLWPGFAKEIEAASGLDVGFRQCGTLIVATTEGEAAAFAATAEAIRMDAAETCRMEPMLTPAIAGGLWAPGDAQVDNRLLGLALARAFVAGGGTLSLNEPVVNIAVDGGSVIGLDTPFGRQEADAYIIAAGAWSREIGGLPPHVLPPVRPVKGEMIAIAPPAGAALPLHLVWGNGIYLVPRPDRLLVGATVAEAGFDTSVTGEAADWLSSRAVALMPALAGWEVVERWAGLRPGSPDGLPILGPAGIDKLFIASGQYRNGILFAPAVAEHISRIVLEHAAPLPAFDPRRFHKSISAV